MPRKTEKRRKSRKNRSQKNRTEKRKMRGGFNIFNLFGKKEETKIEGETGQVNPLIKKEGIKEEPKKEEVRNPEPVESSQTGQEKKGWFDWLKPKPKEPVPPAPPATGGKRRHNRNKKQ